MQEIPATIGDAIRSARKQKGYTIEYVASLMDPPVTKATVSAWETGRNRIKADALDQICTILEVDASRLMPSTYSYAVVKPTISDDDRECDELARYMSQMSKTQRSAVLSVARAMVE